LRYFLTTEENTHISADKSLIETGVENFQTLYLMASEVTESKKDEGENDVGSTNLEAYPELPLGLQGTILPSLWAQLSFSIRKPSLISTVGLIFELGVPPISIGLQSKDYHPTIDLTDLNINKVISINHAEINFSDGEFSLMTLTTTNDTFLNSIKLRPNEELVLKNGDTILFGQGGVKLVFYLPQK